MVASFTSFFQLDKVAASFTDAIGYTEPAVNRVAKIYTSARIADFDYLPYREAIEKCRRDPDGMGIALSQEKQTGSFCPVFLKKSLRSTPYDSLFTAYRLVDGELLGQIAVHLEEVPGSAAKANRIYVFSLESRGRDRFKGVGTLLIKCALQEFSECENRMQLESTKNSGPFYYRLGFRISERNDKYLNGIFAEIAERGETSQQDFGFREMSLPAEARELWREELVRDPIRFPCFKQSSL